MKERKENLNCILKKQKQKYQSYKESPSNTTENDNLPAYKRT